MRTCTSWAAHGHLHPAALRAASSVHLFVRVCILVLVERTRDLGQQLSTEPADASRPASAIHGQVYYLVGRDAASGRQAGRKASKQTTLLLLLLRLLLLLLLLLQTSVMYHHQNQPHACTGIAARRCRGRDANGD